MQVNKGRVMQEDKVFTQKISKKFEFDVKSVSRQQLLVVCSFGTEMVGTTCSHVGLLSNDGNRG
jgi:hypothetical protein